MPIAVSPAEARQLPVVFPTSPRTMWDFHAFLPLADPAKAVTLGEGVTPLLPASSLGPGLFLKLENLNPTGSQKDRALSVSISKARELGYGRAVIASTGSAGLSCAAYCARAGLQAAVLVPRGTPPERLLPMQALGAFVCEVQGTFLEIEAWLGAVRATGTWFDATTKREANPFHLEGPKTIAYEIALDLKCAPNWVLVPVGGGATLHGIWRGFLDLVELDVIERPPRMASVQSERFNALERALIAGARADELERFRCDERVETIMRNLKHGVPPDGAEAYKAVLASNGTAISVSEEAALACQRRLGHEEGIFCEPSSAASVAGAALLRERGLIRPGETVVSIITGSGLREPSSVGTLRLNRLDPSMPASELDRIFAEPSKA